MIVFPNCKINLGLFVTEKRSDGFHNLESIFLPVPCCDALEVIESPNGKIEFSTSGMVVDGNKEDNICFKAYKLMQMEYDLPAVHIHLRKQIPMGAGLGGGSSDGAFMLRLLNDLFELRISSEKLKSLAAALGSDCPFFIDNRPSFVYGRGDKLQHLNFDLSNTHVALIHPNIHISTPKAFSLIKPKPAPFDLRDIDQIKKEDWKNILVNDFEKPIMELHPIISEIIQSLYDKGAFYASMSGSGSAVFGLFQNEIRIDQDMPNYYTWIGKF